MECSTWDSASEKVVKRRKEYYTEETLRNYILVKWKIIALFCFREKHLDPSKRKCAVCTIYKQNGDHIE